MKMKAALSLLVLILIQTAYGQARPKLGPGRNKTSVERMSIANLRAVHEDRMRHAAGRQRVRLSTGLRDLRAILHAHAEDSPHTGGTLSEMLGAARRAGVNIIMLSNHRQPGRDFMKDGWRGLRDGVLFIPGAEADGFLLHPVASIPGGKTGSRQQLVRIAKEGGGNIFLSHVEEKLDWITEGLDGLEIYNHHADVKDELEFMLWLRGAMTDRARLKELEQALALYPQEVFASQQDYLAPVIEKWDRDLKERRLTGVAANDSHHNQVFTIKVADEAQAVDIGLITSHPTLMRISAGQAAGVAELVKGRRAGEMIAKLDFDPYERSFRYVSTHILARELTETAVREALRGGRAYVSHDYLCDPTGFAFLVERGGRARAVMGDEIRLERGMTIKIETPAACTLKLIHNGTVARTIEGRQMSFGIKEPGVYRVEAWLEAGGELRPWIYSNPIYVR
jgi:hypothetical protein